MHAKFPLLVVLFLTGVVTMKAQSKTETITLGTGCFWCSEAVFERVPGVVSVVSGYSGGTVANPGYEQVCTGSTGHAECVQVEFDPAKTSLEKILAVFWEAHDPTTLNRQGADIGTQYRSAIFYRDETQKQIAEKSKAAAQQKFTQPIVTEITPFKAFYQAEDYHQEYFKLNGHAPYCQSVIAPKVRKLQQEKVIP
jgi:peptide-methionine (S)-S-oxide reductase